MCRPEYEILERCGSIRYVPAVGIWTDWLVLSAVMTASS
jgi:hypothetical protein